MRARALYGGPRQALQAADTSGCYAHGQAGHVRLRRATDGHGHGVTRGGRPLRATAIHQQYL